MSTSKRPPAGMRRAAPMSAPAKSLRRAPPPLAAPVRDLPPKLQPTDASATDTPLRLSRRMSELGLCSRREADAWIERGWVFVDGERIDTLGTKILPGQRISIDRRARLQQEERVTFLLHKPVGVVSGQAEEGYRPAITLINPLSRWKADSNPQEFHGRQLRGLAPAGRLDIDSTGLLILTQDGRIAKTLIGEDSDIEKEYLVRVAGSLIPDGLSLLAHGLSLDGRKLKPARVAWQNTDQLKFVLREGRKRQIRRMCELVGLRVLGIKRIRIGRIMLGDLPLGAWRYLGPNESF